MYVTRAEKFCSAHLSEKGLTAELRVTLDFLLESALGLLKQNQVGCGYCKENVTNSKQTENG